MNEPRLCPQCGAALPGDALDGLCPQCLAKVVFSTGAVESSQPEQQRLGAAEPDPLAKQVDELVGQMIGPYRLLEQIGEGGFGVVYMAEQIEPVQRKVALKIIKAGMDTKEVVARFEAERQALALMDHPHIAKVLDAGTTGQPRPSDGRGVGGEGFSAGRPFFVMELVRGIPITEFCDQKQLSTAERLQLFMKVCSAVQHAHQKGIIHRDLKPTNILVTLHDGKPAPKVIDFGVAKALGQKLTEKTLFTAFAQLIGTPVYMSPEQAELSGLDIDTRSDIYSLGVLLYELLTGVTPFDREALAKAALDEIRRMIQETEPPKPSTRLQTLGEQLAAVAKCRQTEAPKLIHLVRGDLDWIVMKCLEKDRRRRYETANGLAMDLARHLNHEPVIAAAPSVGYRARKFVGRNKAALTVAGAMVLLLVTGTAVSAWQAVRARRAEHQARTEAHKSSQVAQFLEDMLEGVGPSKAKGRDATMLREILDKTAERVGRELDEQPEVQGELLFIMGEIYRQLGDFEEAETCQREGMEIRLRIFGTDHLEFARSLVGMAMVHYSQNRFDESEGLMRQALPIHRKFLDEGSPELADFLENVGLVLSSSGKLDEAEAYEREALAIVETFGDSTRKDPTTSLNNLAIVLQAKGNLQEAERLFRQVLAAERTMGPDTPGLATVLNNLACVLRDQEKFDEAETMQREALETCKRVFSEEHPDVASAMCNLGFLLTRRGNLAEAEKYQRDALALRQKLLGTNNLDVASSLDMVAWLAESQDRLEEAENLERESLQIMERVSPEHWTTSAARLTLGRLLSRQKKYADAEPLLVTGYEGLKESAGLIPAYYGDPLDLACGSLMELYERWGKPEQVAKWRKELDELRGATQQQSRRAPAQP